MKSTPKSIFLCKNNIFFSVFYIFLVFSQNKWHNTNEMYNFNTSNNHFWKNFLTQISLLFITVTIIVWFLPRHEGPVFRYDIGKPWMYGSLIASFDFPIFKTDEAIKEEQDSLTKKFQPYYFYDASVERAQIEKFLKDYQEGLPGLGTTYKVIICDHLHQLYQTGIIKTQDYNTLNKDTTNMIRVVNKKQATSLQINKLYSVFSAYENLFVDSRLEPHKQLLQRCNLNNYIEPNLIYDKERSQTELNDLLSGISQASGLVISGQKIVDRGDIVDEHTYLVLNSLEREMKRLNDADSKMAITMSGQTIFVMFLVLLFTLYIILFHHDYFENLRSIMMLYSLMIIFPVLVSLMVSHNFFSIYIIPFAIVPIFINVFLDSKTAFVTHLIMVLICAAAVKYQYEFIIIQLVAGLVAIYSLRELSSRAQVFKVAIFVTISSSVIYVTMQMMQGYDLMNIDDDMIYYFIVNGILLLLAYPLMYLIERTFGFISSVTLFELANTNKGLLRNLSEIAPGTFQHSFTVGNLASEIANKIGANSLLVRTGALYHDIGKMTNPAFFTENQAGVNPHDKMTYQESARIVISHVTEGIKMAEKANVPSDIKDFILTHHGKGMAKYFYIKYKNEHPDEEIDTAPFTYPGPNPSTREQAILMMADTTEAASRSLPEYTEESIRSLVDRLIDNQVNEGFFHECQITFREIAMAKEVLIEKLMAIYHTRIKYPEPNEKEDTTKSDKNKKKKKKRFQYIQVRSESK